MRLYPLKLDQLENLRGIFQKRLDESNVSDLTSVDFIINRIGAMYEMQSAGVYVDNVEDPKHCLVMSHFPSSFLAGITAYVSLIYSVPEARGNKEDCDSLFEAADSYARLHGACAVSGSSWLFRGSRGIDALWKSHEYEAQETVYLKLLK